jgi:2-iminoacetate synthase
MLTFEEYLLDYADEELRQLGERMIAEEMARIPAEKRRAQTAAFLERLRRGERDLRF